MSTNRTAKIITLLAEMDEEFILIRESKAAEKKFNDKYKQIIKLINRIPLKDKITRLVFYSMAHNLCFRIKKQAAIYLKYCDDTAELFSILKKPGFSSPECIAYANYIINILATTADLCIHTYTSVNTEKNETPDHNSLKLLILAREANDHFIKMPGKTNLIDKTALMLSAKLYYVFDFIKLQNQYNPNGELDSCFDRQKLENLHQIADINSKTDNTNDQQCLVQWFKVYQCDLSTRRFGNYQTLANLDLDKIIEFITSLSVKDVIQDKREIKCPLASFSLGLNIYIELITQTECMIRNIEIFLDTMILNSNNSAMGADCNEKIWQEYYESVKLQLSLLAFKSRFYRLALTRQVLTYEKCVSITMLDTFKISVADNLLASMNEKIRLAAKANKKLYKAELKKEEDARQQSKQKKIENKKSIFDELSSDEEFDTEDSSITDEYENIDNLIEQKKFNEAAQLAYELLKDAGKNPRSIIKAYLYLGDIHHKLGANNLESRNMSERAYKSCVTEIDKYLANDFDEELANLKTYLLAPLTREIKMNEPVELKLSNPTQVTSIPAKITLPKYVNNVWNKLTSAGYKVFLTGGAVRDFLVAGGVNDFLTVVFSRDFQLELKDYDLVTNAPMKVIMNLFAGAGKACGLKNPVYVIKSGLKEIQISTLSSLEDQSNVEMVMLDNDTASFIRRTDDITKDARKRQLTFDALYYDGENIHDYFGGLDDIKNQRIRFILDPAESINTCNLVFYKIIRMISRLEFQMENETLDVFVAHLKLLKDAFPPQANHEITRTLAEKNIREVINLFSKFEIFKHHYDYDKHETEMILQNILSIYSKNESSKLMLYSVIISYRFHKHMLIHAPKDIMQNDFALFHPLFSQFGLNQKEGREIARVLLLNYLRKNPEVNKSMIDLFTQEERELATRLNQLTQGLPFHRPNINNFFPEKTYQNEVKYSSVSSRSFNNS